ncbi:MAG: hypothetical protein QW835_07740 [Candidatus Hadarchaeum sp.]
MTPAQFAALVSQKQHEEDRLNLRAGVIASTIATVMTGKTFQPSDFFKKEPEGGKSWRTMLTTVEMINAALKGQDLRGKKDG